MKHVILGTAGHIDHGKTMLIKALTGVDCDRLKEEKARGITIELGFTFLDLPDGIRIGIIDVPGHERFVHHMVAGVVGMDLVLLVIAADEGIMPQTREHLDICSLLGVKEGLVVISKIDLVEEEWLDLVKDEIGDFLRDTFLKDAPIIPVSSVTGKGLETLILAVNNLANKLPARSTGGIFRLPVDRVFTMRGFGTVVTGTLLSGDVRVGEFVEILPNRIKAKIRGIQVHNEQVEYVSAGQRTAINLQGVDRDEVKRGDVIAQPEMLEPVCVLDARLNLLKCSGIIKNRMRVRFHTGTAEIFGKVILLDRERLEPGDSALVQLRLEEKIAVMPNDRYIIRKYSPLITLGGGEIIDNHPQRHKRYKDEVLDGIHALEYADIPKHLEIHIKKSGVEGIDIKGLVVRTNLDPQVISDNLIRLKEGKKILIFDDTNLKGVHREIYEGIRKRLLEILKDFHLMNPLKSGISKEELKARLSRDIDQRFFNILISDLIGEGLILLRNDQCAIAGHKVTMLPAEKCMYDKILNIFKKAGLAPPNLSDVYKELKADEKGVKRIIDLLIDEGMLFRLKEGLVFYKDALERIEIDTRNFLEDRGEIALGDFKDFIGLSRKYAVAILEYLDSKDITRRIGDKRVLKKK